MTPEKVQDLAERALSARLSKLKDEVRCDSAGWSCSDGWGNVSRTVGYSDETLYLRTCA